MPDARVLEAGPGHLIGPHAPIHQRGGHGPRQAVLRLFGRPWPDRAQMRRRLEGVDANALNRLRDRGDAAGDAAHALDRRLRPPATSMRLEVELDEPIVAAEVGRGVGARVQDRRDPREPLLGEERRAHPRHRSPPDPVFDHRRVFDAAHDRCQGPMIFGDAERVAQLRGGQPQDLAGRRGRAQRPPGPGPVIVAVARVERDPRADRHLIAGDQGRQKRRARGCPTLGGGQRGREHHGARMSFDRPVAVVDVERIGQAPIREGGPRGTRPEAREQDARLCPAPRARRRGGGDPGHRRAAPGDCSPEHVQQRDLRVPANDLGELSPGGRQDEHRRLGGGGGNGCHRLRHPRWSRRWRARPAAYLIRWRPRRYVAATSSGERRATSTLRLSLAIASSLIFPASLLNNSRTIGDFWTRSARSTGAA